MLNWSLTKVPKQCDGGKTAFSTHGAGATGHPQENKWNSASQLGQILTQMENVTLNLKNLSALYQYQYSGYDIAWLRETG